MFLDAGRYINNKQGDYCNRQYQNDYDTLCQSAGERNAPFFNILIMYLPAKIRFFPDKCKKAWFFFTKKKPRQFWRGSNSLCNIYLTRDFHLLLDDLRKFDGKHAVLDFCLDIFFLHIVRQDQRLLKL